MWDVLTCGGANVSGRLSDVSPRPGRDVDDLCERIELLLPEWERRFRYPGRKPVPDRQMLCGILFVLHTGVQWEHLPQELGFGSGMACWRRLRDWNEAGVCSSCMRCYWPSRMPPPPPASTG